MGRRIVKSVLVALTAVLVLSSLAPATARVKDSRRWKATYNSALSLHEAAVPKVYHVGQKLRLTYKGKSVIVHAIYGGCTCFDISDEAMNKLASTSKGVITVTATKLPKR